MGWTKLPFIIVLIASILPWIAAYMNAKWITYIPLCLSLFAYFVYLIRNFSKATQMSYGFLFVFSVISLSVFWQLINDLGIGSGGSIIVFTLTFVFFKFFRFSHDGISAQSLIKQISIIYAVHITFILFELTFRLLGFTDLLVSIAGNATDVKMYKMYNKAVFLQYIGFKNMTGLGSLLLGSQTASQLTLFSVIWFVPFYVYNPLYQFNRHAYLWFILSIVAFLVSTTMTASILAIMFLLLFIYVIPLSKLRRLRYQIAFPLFTIIFSAVIVQLIFFNIKNESTYLIYLASFMASIETYMSLSPIEQFFGLGVAGGTLSKHADFGLGMLLVQAGILLIGVAVFSLIKIFIQVCRSVTRLKKFSLHRNPWTWLATVNGLLALGWGASLIHYTPAVELGGRELFAFHLAVCLFAVKKMRLHSTPVRLSRACPPLYQSSCHLNRGLN